MHTHAHIGKHTHKYTCTYYIHTHRSNIRKIKERQKKKKVILLSSYERNGGTTGLWKSDVPQTLWNRDFHSKGSYNVGSFKQESEMTGFPSM